MGYHKIPGLPSGVRRSDEIERHERMTDIYFVVCVKLEKAIEGDNSHRIPTRTIAEDDRPAPILPRRAKLRKRTSLVKRLVRCG